MVPCRLGAILPYYLGVAIGVRHARARNEAQIA